jgi:hypothetical protein
VTAQPADKLVSTRPLGIKNIPSYGVRLDKFFGLFATVNGGGFFFFRGVFSPSFRWSDTSRGAIVGEWWPSLVVHCQLDDPVWMGNRHRIGRTRGTVEALSFKPSL